MPELVELRRKTSQRGLLIASWKKDSDRSITRAMEAVCVPAHLALPGSLQAKQLYPLHAQLSLGQSCHRRKRNSCVYTHRSLRSCPTLYEAVDCGLPGFSVRGFSRQEDWSVLANTGCHTLLLLLLSHFSRVRLCVTPWTATHQSPLSLGFSRQEQWSGLPLPSPVHESEK